MDNKTVNLHDVAISIYERMENEDVASSSIDDFKKLQNNILKDVDNKMVRGTII